MNTFLGLYGQHVCQLLGRQHSLRMGSLCSPNISALKSYPWCDSVWGWILGRSRSHRGALVMGLVPGKEAPGGAAPSHLIPSTAQYGPAVASVLEMHLRTGIH